MVQETSSGELDLLATRHKGQYALRKLYHESPRLLAVFYTSPSCGPCRTLKPIFNKVIDEYGDKVCAAFADVSTGTWRLPLSCVAPHECVYASVAHVKACFLLRS